LLGEGFKIDHGVAKSWIGVDDSYNDILFPFIGGNEVNKDPFYRPPCSAINFWDWSEEESRKFVLAYERVKSEVLPARLKQKNEIAKSRWWLHYRSGIDFYHAIGRGNEFHGHPAGWVPPSKPLERVIVISTGVTKYPAFTLLPSSYVYSNKICVLADERFSMLAILTSDIHGVWAWAQKTSLGGDLHSLVYAHGNIFETFPFPAEFLDEGDVKLEDLGRQFFRARQSFMEASEKGLTKFYNDFHNPAKNDHGLLELRQLQAEINEDVWRKYDSDNVELECGFHEVGYLPDGRNTRFTVSEESRLKILGRLSRLNRTRVQEQSQTASPTRSAIQDNVQIEDDALEDDLFTREGGKS